MLTREKTPLLEINFLIKKRLWKNQSVFYNLLFQNDLEKIRELVEKIKIQLKELYENEADIKTILDSECAEKFYRYVQNVYDNQKIKQGNIKKLKRCEWDSNDKSNVNKVMNGSRSIPREWREKYGEYDGNYREYVCTRAWTLQYMFVFVCINTGDEIFKKTSENISENTETSQDYTEYFTFDDNVWEEITKEMKGKIYHIGREIKSFKDLSELIYKAIVMQCKSDQWVPRGTINLSDNKDTVRKRNLIKEREEYEKIIDCYGAKSLDRYNSLKRNAKNNLYCAYMLGVIYYFGEIFYSGGTREVVEIDKDYKKAVYYFEKCSNPPYIVPEACWSLGYMILNRKTEVEEEKREELAEEYFSRCKDYGPAENSLALLYKERGDNIYKRTKWSENETLKREMVEYYIKFINQAHNASIGGWVYAKNVLYSFYSKPEYKELHKLLGSEERYIECDATRLLKESADMGNVWPMDRLACYYIAECISCSQDDLLYECLMQVCRGDCTLKAKEKNNLAEEEVKIKKAQAILKVACNYNYARAIFHYALNFSDSEGECKKLLNLSASMGEEQAKKKLAEMQS